MANRKVTLVRYCKTAKGWRRYTAAIGKNGRVRPEWVKVSGKLHHYPEGHYEGRYYEGSKLRYLPNLGTDAAKALAACQKHAKLLVARDAATDAGAKIVEEKGRVNLRRALDDFIQATEDKGSMVAAKQYKATGDGFLSTLNKRYADEVEKDDLLRYQRQMRKDGYEDRTIYNRHRNVVAFLKSAGVPASRLPDRSPKYEKTLPQAYSGDEMGAFFASLTEPQHIITFKLALMTGLREQELMHIEWSDLDLERRTLRVRSKPEWGFAIKDKEERDVPVPLELRDLLQEYRTTTTGKLITGTSGEKPNSHLLRLLKRRVKRANIQCKVCSACVERGECVKWFLHKFRATYATTLLRNGVDVRTVQKLMGHSDLESTLKYLRPAEGSELQARLDAISW